MSRRSIPRKFALASTLMTVLLASCGQFSPSSTAPTGKAALPPSSLKTGQPYPIPRTNKLRGQQLTAPFCDDFNSFNTNLWETYKVNANWRSLNSAGTFEPSNLTVENGYLVMKLNQESGDVKSTTTPAVYRSAVFRSVAAMGFGTYDFWMRPASTSKNPAVPGARANGTLADVNLYGETDDTDSNLLPDTLIELRYGYSIPDYLLYTTLRTNQPENSVGVHTGVNMAQGFQHHQWVWTPTSLKMYVGGKLVREETDPSKVPQVAANLAMHLMPTNRPDLGTNLAGNKAPRYTMVDKFCFTPKGAQDFMITPSAPVLGQATTLDASGLAGTDFKWFVGTTQIASGQKTTYTFPTAGSFQVKLTYTNLSGEAKVVTRDVTVSGTNDDAVPIPPDMTYGSPIALEFPVFTADDTAYFDIYRLGDDAYTGKNFRWNFGDGTTATGDAVKHDYKTPGTYTVTLNYEDAKGTTKTFKTQVAAINVAKLVDKGGRSDSLTAKFDAGEEIPGLTYEYTLEDKDNQTATKNGSKVSHTYAGIGTFDYTLTIRDNRAATLGQQSLNRGKMTAQAAEPNRVIFKKTAWHTFWQRAPKAELTWTGSDLAGAPLSTIGVGQSSATVQFSAFYSKDDPRNFQSFDTDLKYEWNFGDGTTSTERDPSHTYTLTKPFLVTLTVTNKYGLKDTKRVWYHIRDFRYDTTLRTEYPNGTITPAATESPKLEAQRVFVISGSPTDIDSEAYLPWVLPNAHNIKRGSHYPIGATGDRTISFCNEYKLYVNGGERYPWYLEQGQTMPDPNILDPIPTMPAAQFCQAMVMVPGNIGALRKSGWNTIEVYSSRGSNRTSVNTFHHLNVPRVMVTVLPDELIPGEQASPVINSYHAFNPDTQVEELIVRVKIRKSEVLDGNIKFKVPVYAVDSTGKRQITVDGAMYARFMNYSESNEPVMFVDGMAEMPVSLNANMFGPDGQEIDLTNIKYFSSKGDCGYGDGPLATAAKQTVAGCAEDKAVYAYPTSNAPADVPQIPEFFKKRLKMGNHVFYGTTKEEQAEKLREVLDQHKRNTLEAIDLFFPILASERKDEYLAAVNKAWEDGHITDGERLQLGALGVVSAADLTPVVHGVMKVSRKVIDGTSTWVKGLMGSSKAAVKAADEAMTVAATAGKLPEEAVKLIPLKLGVNTDKLLNDCNSQICFDTFDAAVERLEKSGRTSEQARFEVDTKINEINSRNSARGFIENNQDTLNEVAWQMQCRIDGNSFSGDTLITTDTGLRRIDQMSPGMKVLAYNEMTQKNGYYEIYNTEKHLDFNLTKVEVVISNGEIETIKTTGNHAFYVDSNSLRISDRTSNWVAASYLKSGDKLKLSNGDEATVLNVSSIQETREMFNLSVRTAHTFYVGPNGILVHNETKIDPCKVLFRGTTEGFPGRYADIGTPTSTNPAVATAYAIQAVSTNGGRGIVRVATPDKLKGIAYAEGYIPRDREFFLFIEPTKFAEISKAIPLAKAASALEEMGIQLPARISDPAHLSDVLGEIQDFSDTQIQQFLAIINR